MVYSNLWRRYLNLCNHHMLPLSHGTFSSVHKREENAGTDNQCNYDPSNNTGERAGRGIRVRRVTCCLKENKVIMIL